MEYIKLGDDNFSSVGGLLCKFNHFCKMYPWDVPRYTDEGGCRKYIPTAQQYNCTALHNLWLAIIGDTSQPVWPAQSASKNRLSVCRIILWAQLFVSIYALSPSVY